MGRDSLRDGSILKSILRINSSLPGGYGERQADSDRLPAPGSRRALDRLEYALCADTVLEGRGGHLLPPLQQVGEDVDEGVFPAEHVTRRRAYGAGYREYVVRGRFTEEGS